MKKASARERERDIGVKLRTSRKSYRRVGAFAAGAFLTLSTASLSHAGPLLFVGDGGTFTLQTYNGTTGAFIGEDGAGGSIGFPTGIAIGPDGNVYLGDGGNGAVLRFSGANGSFLGQFITPGSGLISPSGLAFGFGNLYAADFGTGGNSFINVYNGTTGAFVTQFGAGAPNGGLFDPNGIAFGPAGLYVADQINGVDVYDPITGAFVSVLVPLGSGPGAPAGLADPSGMAIGPDGLLYVADETNGLVDRFNATTGAFLGVFGATNSLSAPIDLTFGPDGNLYVTDANGVERFNGSTGASLGAFVPAGGNLVNAQYLAFSTPVPEPTTFALLAFGAAVVVGFRKRRYSRCTAGTAFTARRV